MIGFRYHLVSLVAVFLALAGGIALGSGPLQGSVRGQLAGASAADRQSAAGLAEAERLVDFQAAYADATAETVLAGRLPDTSVSLVVLPGADATTVRGVESDLALTDANVVSRVDLTAGLLDPANRQLAEGLAQRVLDGVEGVAVAEGATSYPLVGAALARSYLTTSTEAVLRDDDAASIEAAFVEADLVTAPEGRAENRAELALVVAGSVESVEGESDVAAELATAFDRSAGGVVVLGSGGSGTEPSTVEALRSADADGVSTVDGRDTSAGGVVALLALAEQARGAAGHYGVDAPDGVAPDLGG